MKIGFMEILVIFVVALLVIGPDKLPEYMKKLGVALREFKKASSELTKDIREDVVQPLQEMKRPLDEAVAPINDLAKDLQKELNSVTAPLNDLTKPVSTPAPEAPAAQEQAPQTGAAEAEAPEAQA